MTNREIADRLEAFATLLELSEANPYTARAYGRAAATVRASPTPVDELVRTGRVRSLRGIGRSIESKLRELVETGEIAELAELERELSPELVGLGRYLGLSAQRSVEIARTLGLRTASDFREAAAAGRLRDVPGVGPKREAQILEALAREGEPRPRQGLTLNRAWELVGGVAGALEAAVAGDVRRWRDSSEVLRAVRAAADPAPVRAAFASLPAIVGVIEQEERRAVGLTVEGVPLELLVPEPERFGSELLRATGSPETWRRSSRCPTPSSRRTSTTRWASRGARPSCASGRSAASHPRWWSCPTSAATCTCTRRGPTGATACSRWAELHATAATSTWRSATTLRPWVRCGA
ncbi:MAG: hypothetical protein JW895_02290 [Thermoleophilaceae bacterium]|nr:hypothetical protein [Thermoleophilaceae bacterium]